MDGDPWMQRLRKVHACASDEWVCGMVFQNPDNQFVSSVLEEDIAFGLENAQVPEREVTSKVKEALELVGLEGYEKRSPSSLSGGQKQRAALAGVLALNPEILIFDEATSMLDPKGRREVLAEMKKLRDCGKTVVMITHDVEEAVLADQVILMGRPNGQKDPNTVLAQGSVREILTDSRLLIQRQNHAVKGDGWTVGSAGRRNSAGRGKYFFQTIRSGSSAQKSRNGISVSGISAFCTNRGEGCGLRTEI